MATSISGLIADPLGNKPLPTGASSQKNPEEKEPFFADSNTDYHPILSNWYTAKPYGFTFTQKSGRAFTIFLPISPYNLTITTNFATNMTATLYGTVEEHSPVRYYDISIEGTTGIGPKYVDLFEEGGIPPPNIGRGSFSVKQGINNIAGGFFAKTLSTVDSSIQKAKDVTKGVEPLTTGISVEKTGYYAFHNLYRFLLKYKKDVSGEIPGTRFLPRAKDETGSDVHPLTFFNYKDNNQYKVVIRSMTLKRDREDPMLYNYNIVMRGYDLSNANQAQTIDRLGQTIKDLGLDGVKGSSLLTNIKDISRQGKSLLGGIGAGINQVGR